MDSSAIDLKRSMLSERTALGSSAAPALGETSFREPTAGVRYLVGPMAALRQRGIDASPLLHKFGLPSPAECDPSVRVTANLMSDFWDACAEASGDDAFGLHIGLTHLREYFPPVPDVLRHLVRQTGTLGEAIEHAVRYQRMVAEGRRPSLSLEGDRAVWAWRSSHGVRFSRSFSEHVLTYLCRPEVWAARNPEEVELLEVHFPLEPPQSLAEYEAFFKVPLRFRCGYAALVFSRRSMAARSSQADVTLEPILARVADEELCRIPSVANYADRVRTLLHRAKDEGPLGLHAIAQSLGTGERTLRRRLAEENTSYSELVDEWRMARAQQLVRDTKLSMTDVALALGYTEQNAFARAYRRWFGASPASDRKEAEKFRVLNIRRGPRACGTVPERVRGEGPRSPQ